MEREESLGLARDFAALKRSGCVMSVCLLLHTLDFNSYKEVSPMTSST
jgi:hypothetical protein